MSKYQNKARIVMVLTTLILGIRVFLSPIEAMGDAKPYAGTTIYGIIGAFARFDPLWGPYDGPPYGYPLIKDFEKETGIRVKVRKIMMANLPEKEMLELVSPKGYMSFLTVNVNWYVRFKDHLKPLNEYLTSPKYPKFDWDDVTKGGKNVVTVDDIIYGLPIYVYSPVFGYRKDLYEEYGLSCPESFTGVVENARKLTVDLNGDGITDRYGISLVGKKSEILWWPITCLYGFGERLFDEKMKPVIDNETSIKSCKTFASIGLYCPPGVLGNEKDTVNLQFKEDKIAMYWCWPFTTKQLRETVLPKDMIPKLGVFGILGEKPATGALIEGWGISIPKTAPHKDAAYLFIDWLASKSTMRDWQFTRTPGPPALKSVLGDPEVRELNPEFLVLDPLLRIGRTLPRIPEWFAVTEVLKTYYSEVLGRTMTPEEAMHQAAREIEKIMREAGYYKE